MAAPAPRRRFSAIDAVNRYGRWGTQEKCARHSRTGTSDDSRASILMVPAERGANPSRASNTEDLPAPEGPTERDLRTGRRVEGEGGQGGGGAVVVLDPESLNAQIDGGRGSPTGARSDSAGAATGLAARRSGPSAARARTSSTRVAAACPSVLAWNSAPAAAEGDEDLRGYKEHGQRGVEVELPPQQAQAQDHGDQADAESGDEVHGQGGEERHAQRPHGSDAHPFGGFDDLTAAVPVPPEGPQCGQSLNELEEPPGQRAEAAPLPRRAPVRLPSEVDHGDRDGYHQGHHDDQREPVLCGDPDQKDQRHHRGHSRLGEIAGEVGMQRTQPARGGE